MSSDELSLHPPARGTGAARYRVQFLNADGSILGIQPLVASNDAEAIKQAKRLMDGRALDLWDGLRFIEFFPAIEEA